MESVSSRPCQEGGKNIRLLTYWITMLKCSTKYKQRIVKIQAIYFLSTGIWPVLHIDSFMNVTGHKTDIWLVQMVGLLAFSIGLSVLVERRSMLLPICASSSFAIIDILYTLQGTISPIYLVDFFIQVICLFFYALPGDSPKTAT